MLSTLWNNLDMPAMQKLGCRARDPLPEINGFASLLLIHQVNLTGKIIVKEHAHTIIKIKNRLKCE